ncbi:MAG: hypothetical protein CMJ85_14020 [Planctomycetes bacterium]|jgi:hypothetical protein|nr:hypothetical protein [Planctomycetota bacterium]MDP6423874.1 hypothetical protein [Planctomycetota bacterium]
MITHFDRPWSMGTGDLNALRSLVALHPKVRWTHLYNPVAYTQATPLRAEMEKFVLDASRSGHEVGMHVHMYRSLVESAGVTFRMQPSVSCGSDSSGYRVPISSYGRPEIHRVIERGVTILRSRGLPPLKTFCAGFYTTSVALQGVITDLGFTVSAAAYPVAAKFGRNFGGCWPSLSGWDATVTEMTRPYLVSKTSILPAGKPPYLACSRGPLMELVQTCKIDWMVTAAEMKAVFDRHVAVAANGTSTVVCLSFHEESASANFTKFDDVLTHIDAALNGKTSVAYATASQIREAFLPTQFKVARPLTASRCALYPQRLGRVALVDYDLDAGTTHANKAYVLLSSAAGTSPGLRLSNHVLPLNPDPWLTFTLAHPNAFVIGSLGLLDARAGTGQARIALPAALAYSLIGLSLHHAFVVIDPSRPSFDLTSNAVPLVVR